MKPENKKSAQAGAVGFGAGTLIGGAVLGAVFGAVAPIAIPVAIVGGGAYALKVRNDKKNQGPQA
jgi:hypothetical protein